MSKPKQPDLEARIRAEVDRSVAPYEGIAPPFVIRKMRELSERYWREHPEASRVLKLLDHRERLRSGPTEEAQPDQDRHAAGDRKKA